MLLCKVLFMVLFILWVVNLLICGLFAWMGDLCCVLFVLD